jgi:hypothetical protein
MCLAPSLAMLKQHFFFHVNSVCNAQVIGRYLAPLFMFDISNPEGYSILKYLPGAKNLYAKDMKQDDTKESPEWQSLIARYKKRNQVSVVNALMAPLFMDPHDVYGVSDDDPFE